MLGIDYGQAGAAGAWATPQHPPGPQDRLLDYGPEGAAGAAAKLSVLQDLSRDYGPIVSSGRRCRLRQGRSTFQGTTGRMHAQEGYARVTVHCCKRTTLPCDLQGAGLHVSLMLGRSH